ncbi:hypothetical protein E8E14_012410 [Neopestalotiopsis sp. 37M]|nr:hypothetical protein E8E14_012410 [Neopestalotiopsis sp. 37M]
MHFLVIGGTGRIGSLVIEEALSRGHQVTALVRSSTSVTAKDGLLLVEGSPLKPEDVDRAFQANPSSTPTTVVVALNARRVSDSPFSAPSPDTPQRLMADSVSNAIASMKKYGADKIVINSSAGTADSYDSLNCLMKMVVTYSNMKYQMVDHNAVDTETRASGVNFVIVRPAMFVEGEAAEVKVYPDDGKGSGFMPKISRASVARFMVAKASETTEFDGRAPVISN